MNNIKWKVKETGEEIIIGTTRPELICTCGMIIFNPKDDRYKHLNGKTAVSPIFGKEVGKDFYEGKTTLPLIIIFQRGNTEERRFLKKIFEKKKRNEVDFSETLALINKYKAVQASFKRAEYFVNISYDALGIFEHSEEKNILQNLTEFSVNRSF